MATQSVERSITTRRKRQKVTEDNDEKEEIKPNNMQFDCMSNNEQRDQQEGTKHTSDQLTVENEQDGEIQDETLVVLDLCDFKNHPLFDDCSSAMLEGIDTATPMLKIGEYTLYGQLEETVGTNYFYDTNTTSTLDKTYQFVGQTIKKIKFTIAPPEE